MKSHGKKYLQSIYLIKDLYPEYTHTQFLVYKLYLNKNLKSETN